MKFRNVAKVFTFFVILCIVFSLCENILTEKWIYKPEKSEGETNRYESFYKLPNNTVDYIVLGVSHSFFSINPMLIYAQEGYTGYDLGSPGQTIEISYLWLQEACKYQTPKYVFYDVASMFYDEENKNEGNIVKGLTYMKLSWLKLQAAYECKLSEMSVMQLVSPMYEFHARWKYITKEDFGVDEHYYPYKGTCLYYNMQKDTEKNSANKYNYLVYENDILTLQKKEVSKENINTFYKMYLFCQEKGIKLVPIKCPTMYWDKYQVEEIKDVLSQFNLTLLDMNTEVNINWESDTLDNGKHTNFWGNCKTSHWLAEYLAKESKLSDYRQEVGYEIWNKDLEEYREFEGENLRTNEEKVLTYLQILEKNKSNLCIVFSGKDDMCSSWNQELQSYIERFGLTSDFYNNVQNSYIGVVDGGNVKIDNFAEYPLVADISIELENKISQQIKVKSGGFVYGNVSEIYVNDINYSMNNRGINIVAIDRNTGEVVSAASIDTWSRSWTYRETIWNNELWENCKESGSQILEEGIYTIHPANDVNYALDIPDEGKESGLVVQLRDVNGDISQQFEIIYCGSGLYMLRAVCSGKYLTVKNFGNTCGTSIIQEEYTGLSNQKWYIYENNNEYTVMSHYNQLVIDVTGREAVPDLQIQLYENYSEQWQQFSFEKIS